MRHRDKRLRKHWLAGSIAWVAAYYWRLLIAKKLDVFPDNGLTGTATASCQCASDSRAIPTVATASLGSGQSGGPLTTADLRQSKQTDKSFG